MSYEKFTDEQLADLRQKIEAVQEYLPDNWLLAISRVGRYQRTVVFDFEFPGVPEVDHYDEYLAVNYAEVSMSTVPGHVNCEDYEQAVQFLGLVFEYAVAQKPIDYHAVLQVVQAVHREAWSNAIGAFTDEFSLELPQETDGAPYWLELPVSTDAELITTVGETNAYGHRATIVPPEDKAAILIKILFDSNEGEVELVWALEDSGIPEDSLEEFLVEQLLCTNRGYAYVRYDLMAAIWLAAVPENREFLRQAVESEDFGYYYEEYAYRAGTHGHGRHNERTEAVQNWLHRVREIERERA